MKRHTRLLPLLCVAFACAPQPGTGDDSTSTTTNNNVTSDGQSETGQTPTTTTTETEPPDPPGTTTPTTPTTPTTASDDTSTSVGDFIVELDGGNTGPSCDVFAQDCPRDMKCTWWADDGGSSWNSTKCVPLAPDPTGVGEPCHAEGGGVSGIDDCELGAMCWDVDAAGDGRCIAFCSGSPRAPTCAEGSSCAITSDGFALCLPFCDPLAQDCPGDDVCIPGLDSYLCVIDASGAEGQLHDTCDFPNACDPGLLCVASNFAAECDPASNGCCEPYCDLGQPDCPGLGQTCVPMFDPQPAGFEHIGICNAMP